jgi:hypothetical protein
MTVGLLAEGVDETAGDPDRGAPGEARRESRPGLMVGIAGEDGTGRVGSRAASEGYLPD